jgi:hypothetical protein
MAEEPMLTAPVSTITLPPAQAPALTREQWNDISRRLQEPFDPREVDFRVQGKVNEQSGRAQVVAYIDARAVQDRLDAVVGAGNWSFDWTPLVIDRGEVQVTKGVLTLYGVSKADAGSASNFEQTLGAVSHCFKRAAVHWGIGRYLYSLPATWVAVERGGRIPDAVLNDLRARLPRPAASATEAAPATVAAPSEAERATSGVETSPARANGRSRPPASLRESPAAAADQAIRRPGMASTRPGAEEPREQPASEQQLTSLRKLCQALERPTPEPGLSHAQAGHLIVQLSAEYQRLRKAS